MVSGRRERERDSSREVSNETSWGICEFARLSAMSGMPKLVSVQNSYSLLVRGNFETDLAEVSGVLSAKPHSLSFFLFARVHVRFTVAYASLRSIQ